MENRLDQLFRKKLSKREEIPSQQAWDHLNVQLKKGRRTVWMKRLGIAATILLFATIAVKLLDFRSFESNKSLSKSMTETEGIEKEILPSVQPVMIGEKLKLEIPQKTKPEVGPRAEKPLIAKREIPEEGKKSIIIERSVSEIHTDQEEMATQDTAEFMEKEGILEVDGASLLAEGTKAESLPEQAAEKKKYQKVTIIYKASKNSTLVEPGKKNLIEKGIGEITKFSNDHLLTENRKAQLSQTKDDLTALNFGKIFTNKSD